MSPSASSWASRASSSWGITGEVAMDGHRSYVRLRVRDPTPTGDFLLPTRRFAMEAEVRLDHQLLAVESEHDVHVMLELRGAGGGALCTAAAEPRARARPLRLDGRREARLRQTVRRLARVPPPALPTGSRSSASTTRSGSSLRSQTIGAQRRRARDRRRSPPGGMTNLSGGWLKGVEELRRAPPDRAAQGAPAHRRHRERRHHRTERARRTRRRCSRRRDRHDHDRVRRRLRRGAADRAWPTPAAATPTTPRPPTRRRRSSPRSSRA